MLTRSLTRPITLLASRYMTGPRVMSGIWTPAALFAAGQQGVWYEPKPEYLYQDSAGMTPAGLEDPIGLQLDKSKGLKLGPELVTNGTFDSDIAGWVNFADTRGTISWESGRLRLTSASSGGEYRLVAYTSVPTEAGKTYRIKGDTFSSAENRYFVGNSIGSSGLGSEGTAGDGSISFVFRAIGATTYIHTQIITNSPDLVAEFDNITVKELPGNHRFQDVSADRPILSARYNLLLSTETLATQSVTTKAQDYQLRFSGTGSITLSGTATGTFNAGTHTITATAGTLTLTVSGSVTQADLLPAQESSLPYQRVNTATDYDGDKSKFPRYLRGNGVNTRMKTAAFAPGSDKVAAFMGLRKLSDSATGIAFTFGANGADGSFTLFTPDGAASNAVFQSRGTISSKATATGLTAPLSLIATAIGDISGDSVSLSIDGGAAVESTSDQGTGNYGTLAAEFFANTDGTLFADLREYSSVVRFGPITADETNAIEQYIASRVPGVTV